MTSHATTDVVELVREAQKEALVTLERFQQISLKGVEAAAAFVPTEPWPGFANDVAKPTELVEAMFAFYGDVLESQKTYALRLSGIAAKAARSGAEGAKKAA